MASMKNVLESLSLKKQDQLARLVESDDYAVLVEAMQLLRINAATFALDAKDFPDLRFLAGQAHGLKQFHLNLKALRDKRQKELDGKGKS